MTSAALDEDRASCLQLCYAASSIHVNPHHTFWQDVKSLNFNSSTLKSRVICKPVELAICFVGVFGFYVKQTAQLPKVLGFTTMDDGDSCSYGLLISSLTSKTIRANQERCFTDSSLVLLLPKQTFNP